MGNGLPCQRRANSNGRARWADAVPWAVDRVGLTLYWPFPSALSCTDSVSSTDPGTESPPPEGGRGPGARRRMLDGRQREAERDELEARERTLFPAKRAPKRSVSQTHERSRVNHTRVIKPVYTYADCSRSGWGRWWADVGAGRLEVARAELNQPITIGSDATRVLIAVTHQSEKQHHHYLDLRYSLVKRRIHPTRAPSDL